MKADTADCARSFRLPEVVMARRRMVQDPHIAPLTAFVENLRAKRPTWEFPDFDPLDGGVDADILFLLEKPGPMTSSGGKGSGFISRNNDDPSAEATFVFMNKAGLPRKRTVLWNIIPGWNGSRKVTSAELRLGVEDLNVLLPLLPKLRTIVLVGKRAQRARELFVNQDLRIFDSAHPSPIVRASRPDAWRAIPSIWTHAGYD
ncbi:uracil-DNA glycosylase [Candidimonas sp. SYP-B2681]|uniref:uracil-DNA glycosylase n=1 Tax=Candidimonas sp. SYP-B2681 TaxID=2497686 RepID=UPI000F86DCA9|nr:uracil-DNA glycosylase [Candidimonas sp. SYP-B2681]RTZ48050.1 uracil-DNA glycosylase [Candidimonas sp. SYP-B2681]